MVMKYNKGIILIFFLFFKFLVSAQQLDTMYVKGIALELVKVEGGIFTRGCDDTSKTCLPCNRGIQTIQLSTFYVSKYEVTQELYQAVMSNNPSYVKKKLSPVTCLDWYEVQQFIDSLNAITHFYFRMPTEAEWEFAAHGGNFHEDFLYSGSNNIEEVSWYTYSYSDITNETILFQWPNKVGTKEPNALGIYDMTGNVAEWCSDWYDDKYYSKAKMLIDPTGPKTGVEKVLRGGSFGELELRCKVTKRTACIPNYKANYNIDKGIRLVISDIYKK
jgi:formylglycine-generating enzyme required for sulfatase activity